MTRRFPSDAGSILDPARLRYITEKVGSAGRSGLMQVWGGGVLCMQATPLLWPLGPIMVVLLMADLLYMADYFAIWREENRLRPRWTRSLLLMLESVSSCHYYRRRFGRVEPKLEISSSHGIRFLLLLALLIWLLWLSIKLGIVRRVGLIISHFVPQSAYALLLWSLPLLLFRGRAFERNREGVYFFLLGTIVYSWVAFYPLWNPAIRQLELWRILNAGWAGISLTAISLHNHLALARLLPKRSSEEDTHEGSSLPLESARLALLTILSFCASADPVFLQRATGLGKTKLSALLSSLEQAALVVRENEMVKLSNIASS